MRIIVIHEPPVREVDGIRLDVFHRGIEYEMGSRLGALFLAEGWGEPAPDEAAMLIPMSEISADNAEPLPPNLVREIFPPYYDAPPALAADRRRRQRDSRKKS